MTSTKQNNTETPVSTWESEIFNTKAGNIKEKIIPANINDMQALAHFRFINVILPLLILFFGFDLDQL